MKLIATDLLAKIFSTGLQRIWHFVCQLLFEAPCCLLCQVEIASMNSLCPDCLSFFSSLSQVKTTLIGDDDGPTITCYSSGFYAGPLQEAIYQIKYLKRPELAKALAFSMIPPTVALLQAEPAGKGSAERLAGRPDQSSRLACLVVPVPLHRSKIKERGFNQSEELALHVSRLLNLKMDSTSLKRIRPTRPQFGLSRGERRRNLAGAFAASSALAGKKVILVDDVLTSGATIYECALAVTAAGGNVIGAVTLARAQWQKSGQPEESTMVPAISLVL